jgi:hypothetical protein
MMIRWIIVALLTSLLAGCKMGTPRETPTAADLTPETTAAIDSWAHRSLEGVDIAIQTPPGWQAIHIEDGLLLAEHANLEAAEGALVYIFVYDIDELEPGDNVSPNLAWQVLNSVAQMPEHMENSVVSETVAFGWSGHQAAYYLLTDRDHNHTMVVALALPSEGKLVIANISTPAKDADRIREVLPIVLSDLTVNGERMDVSALDELPDPLEFPRYQDSP